MYSNPQITAQQLELLKGFKYLKDEVQIAEVKELLNLYYRHKLDAAIDEAEAKGGFTKAVYDAWLKGKSA